MRVARGRFKLKCCGNCFLDSSNSLVNCHGFSYEMQYKLYVLGKYSKEFKDNCRVLVASAFVLFLICNVSSFGVN